MFFKFDEKFAGASRSKALETIAAEGLQLSVYSVKAASSEFEAFGGLVAEMQRKKTAEEALNSLIGYWSGAAIRSMGYAGRAKDSAEKCAKAMLPTA